MAEKRYFGKRIKRNEDPRLLTGQALFTDDVNLPNMGHAAFVRSPYAHARILGIDVSAVTEKEGVIAIYTAESLKDLWKHGPLLVNPPPIKDSVFNERMQVALASDKVRYAGEPVVMVVAESRYIAEDAVDEIWVDYEPLTAVVDLEQALQEDAPLVHEDIEFIPGVGANVNAHAIQVKGSGERFDAIAAKAAHVVKRRFYYDHGTAAAMENRGIVADWDHRAGRLTLWETTQAPVFLRNIMAAYLGLSEHQVRVIAPFIGGGFGPKIMLCYSEEMVVPWAAMQLRRPIKWIEDRSENFVATTQERDQIHWAEMALDENGRILAVRDKFLHDAGAYAPYGLTVPLNSSGTLLGSYDIPAYYSEFTCLFTNKTIVTPYRGAGRQHGVFVMERLLDIAAKEMGIDRTEIRRRNFIQPDQFPYDNEILFQDFGPLTYDSGNYEPALDRAMEMIDYAGFAEMKAQARIEGRYIGLGLVCYVEGTGIGPYEGARVQVQSNGRVSVATGIGTQGQGHFTSFAQIVADQLGVPVTKIDLITGDTDQFHWGAGTFASRGAVVAGNAIHAAAKNVRQKILDLAVTRLDNVPPEHLELVDGHVQIIDVPESAISLADLAQAANPMRGAVQPGTEPGLESSDYFGPRYGATASGVHAMIVEVDPETMYINILKYVIIHDCGEVINPLILDGQIHGGVAQGIGNAFYEKLSYSADGQMVSGSFMDYLLPTSLEVPQMEMEHITTPSPLNPLGVKGAGEAGAIPVGALFAQALEDALDDTSLEILEIPLSPSRLWHLVNGE